MRPDTGMTFRLMVPTQSHRIEQLKMSHLGEVDQVNPKGQIGWMMPSGCQPCNCDVDRPLLGSRALGGNGKAVHGRLRGDAASSSDSPWLLPHPTAPIRPEKNRDTDPESLCVEASLAQLTESVDLGFRCEQHQTARAPQMQLHCHLHWAPCRCEKDGTLPLGSLG